MQTFLPYPSMGQSVRCLDYRRLGKQRVEALQILNALDGKSKGWTNLHASHRSNLLKKDPEHYGQFGWSEPHDLAYVWPTT